MITQGSLYFTDGVFARRIRVSNERIKHLEENHPEMEGQFLKIEETLEKPDEVIESNSDNSVELYYKKYFETLFGIKYLCVAVKIKDNDFFMLTAYFTDKIKQGNVLWKKK